MAMVFRNRLLAAFAGLLVLALASGCSTSRMRCVLQHLTLRP